MQTPKTRDPKCIKNGKNGVPQHRPKGYYVKSWIFLPHHGNSHSAVNVDFLETTNHKWRP